MFGHRYFGKRYFGPRYFGPPIYDYIVGDTSFSFSLTSNVLGDTSLSTGGLWGFIVGPATIRGDTFMKGDTFVTFTPTSSVLGEGVISGDIPVVFSLSGDVLGENDLTGTASIVFNNTGNIIFYEFPYDLSVGSVSDYIYTSNTEQDSFLYYTTTGNNPNPIYEEN